MSASEDLLAALHAAGLTDFRVTRDGVVWTVGDGDELIEWADGGYGYRVLGPLGEPIGHVTCTMGGLRSVWVAMLPSEGEAIVSSLIEGIVWVVKQLKRAERRGRGGYGYGFGCAPHWAGRVGRHERTVEWEREDGLIYVTHDLPDAELLAALRRADQDDWPRWSARWDSRGRE